MVVPSALHDMFEYIGLFDKMVQLANSDDLFLKDGQLAISQFP